MRLAIPKHELSPGRFPWWVRDKEKGKGQPHGENKAQAKKLTVEEAISAWENDRTGNPEGYKVARGTDGRPVEVVIIKSGVKPVWGIHVNGKNDNDFQFQIGGSMRTMEEALGNLQFAEWVGDDVLNGWYDLKGVKIIKAEGLSKAHQGFVFGLPGAKPEILKVGLRGN